MPDPVDPTGATAPLFSPPPAKAGRRQSCTARAWISRDRPGDVFQSHVSLGRGKVRTRSTATKIRAAALDFNRHHLLELLREEMNLKPQVWPAQPDMEQPDIFSD